MRKLLCAGVLGAFAAVACSGDGATTPTPSSCSPSSSGGQATAAPGEVQVFSGPAGVSCVTIPASGSPSDYIAIVANANPMPDATFSYAITATSGSGLAAAASLPAFDRKTELNRALSGLPFGPQDRLEQHVRAMERSLDLRAAGRYWKTAGAGGPAIGAGARATIVSSPRAVGDTVVFNVPNAATANLCTNFTAITAVVKAISTHAIIVQDVTSPGNGFTSADFAAIANEFDTELYPSDTVHFGSPSDLDINGRILILFTPAVNKLTKRGETGFVGGFFFGGDLFPTAQCAESNRAELFYLLAPDPAGQFSDVRKTSDVRQATRGTIVHEFQHMINAGTRLHSGSDFEVSWLDEALAHLAEELAGRREHGFADLQSLDINDIADEPDFNDFNAFFFQNLARFREWLRNPAALGAISQDADTSLAVRGAAWSLVRYTGDQYSNGDFARFTRSLVATGDTGVTNLTRHAGASFDDLMSGWMVANYADDAGIAGLDDRYTYKGWNMRSVERAINSGSNSYPLQVTQLSFGTAVSKKAPAGGGSFYEIRSSAATPAIGLGVAASGTTPLSDPFARLYILRLE